MERTLTAFEYFAPINVSDALAMLEKYGESARLLAGGTDLIVAMKKREISQSYIIDLKQITELSFIRNDDEKSLSIGALTKMSELALSELLRSRYAAVSDAALSIGSPQIRNRATLGGNLCSAAPSADMAPPLIALDAQAKISSPRGERTIPIERFFTAPGETALAPDELLTEISIPFPPKACGYAKEAARPADIAVVGIAAALFPKERVSLAMGAVAPTPIRARAAEALLNDKSNGNGNGISEQLLAEAAEKAAAESSPISDVRSSAWYRREIIKVLTHRVIRQLMRQTEGIPPRG